MEKRTAVPAARNPHCEQDPAAQPQGHKENEGLAAELTVWCLRLTGVWWQPPRGAPDPLLYRWKKLRRPPKALRIRVGADDLTHPDLIMWPQCVATEIWDPLAHPGQALKGTNTRGPHAFPLSLWFRGPGGGGSSSAPDAVNPVPGCQGTVL